MVRQVHAVIKAVFDFHGGVGQSRVGPIARGSTYRRDLWHCCLGAFHHFGQLGLVQCPRAATSCPTASTEIALCTPLRRTPRLHV